MRDEFHQDQDDLYAAIYEIEVSIHSLMSKNLKAGLQVNPRHPPMSLNYAAGAIWVQPKWEGSHQAFFNTGKSNIAVEKGGQVLGEWRLSNFENGGAIFTHLEGKSLTIKAFTNE